MAKSYYYLLKGLTPNAHAPRRGQDYPHPLTELPSHNTPLSAVRCSVWLGRTRLVAEQSGCQEVTVILVLRDRDGFD
jgi:hypothetical protein